MATTYHLTALQMTGPEPRKPIRTSTHDKRDHARLLTDIARYIDDGYDTFTVERREQTKPAEPATDAPYSFWLGKVSPEAVMVDQQAHPERGPDRLFTSQPPFGERVPYVTWSDWDPRANDVGVVAR